MSASPGSDSLALPAAGYQPRPLNSVSIVVQPCKTPQIPPTQGASQVGHPPPLLEGSPDVSHHLCLMGGCLS